MKKSIFIALLFYVTHLHGYQGKTPDTVVFADALIWKLREASSESWAQEISPSGLTQTVNVVGVPFDWKCGLRVGAERTLKYNSWDTRVYYTYYKSTATSQVNAVSGAISSPYAANFYVNNTNGATVTLDPTYKNASMRWKFNFNVLDLDLGHKFRIEESMQLRPFIALKGAIINQHINTTWQNLANASNFTSATENLKNDFYGFGPAVGLDSNWLLYKAAQSNFNIIANFSGALLWGNWRFDDQYVNNKPCAVTVNVSSINGAAAMTRGLLGLEWNGSVARLRTSIRVGYEAQIWFDQVQFYSYSMGRINSLLSLQGAVLGLGVSF